MTSYPDKRVLEAGTLLKRRLSAVPAVGVILGSGLGELVEETEDPIRIPYADIPYFPLSSAACREDRFSSFREGCIPTKDTHGKPSSFP